MDESNVKKHKLVFDKDIYGEVYNTKTRKLLAEIYDWNARIDYLDLNSLTEFEIYGNGLIENKYITVSTFELLEKSKLGMSLDGENGSYLAINVRLFEVRLLSSDCFKILFEGLGGGINNEAIDSEVLEELYEYVTSFKNEPLDNYFMKNYAAFHPDITIGWNLATDNFKKKFSLEEFKKKIFRRKFERDAEELGYGKET
jgi:hypothetical protein